MENQGYGRPRYGGGQQRMDDYPPPPGSRDSYGGPSNGGRRQCSGIDVPAIMCMLREKCIKRNGACGIRNLRGTFKIYDRSEGMEREDKQLNEEELFHGLRIYGMDVRREECAAIVDEYDKDGNGTLSFNEFMMAVRPPMSKGRMELIDKAFNKLDKTGDGVITQQDLKNVYDVKNHPKFKSGEWTAKKCFDDFLSSFEGKEHGNTPDGKVTRSEFEDYYCGVSSNIDRDVYFDYMMRQAWKL